MTPEVIASKDKMGEAAAAFGAQKIRQAIAERGEAYIIIATGASQFEMFKSLLQQPDIDWRKVTGFHLDEYVGLEMTHPASFRGYLWQRFLSKLPVPLKAFHYIDAEGDVGAECDRLGALIQKVTIDVAFVGIGENAHLAFNDPPADFETATPYIQVELDEACRKQQHSEGWFPTLDDVPTRAISMSIREIMRSKRIVCTVPDERKAQAVTASLEGPVTPDVPASILQQHGDVKVFLDRPAASKLSSQPAAS